MTTCLSLPAWAQTVSDDAGANDRAPKQVAQAETGAHENILQEIVVTSSRKREESVQTTPVAVTAVNADMLDRDHVTSVAGLANLAPNLQISQTVTQGDEVTVYLRGFGAQTNDPSVDPHIAIYIDGIYQPALLGSLIDTFDVSQVEILAGPQGTLLGKNAPIGAVAITTDKPTGDLSGEVEGDYGSYNHFGGRAKLNFPIIEDATGDSILAGKVSFVEKEGGNWIYNTTNDKRDMGGENAKVGRLALAFTPSPDFSWDLVGTIEDSNTPQPGNQNIGFAGVVAGNSSTVNQPGNPLFPGFIPGYNPPTICYYYPHFVCPITSYGTTASGETTTDREVLYEISSNMSYRFTPVTLTSVTGFYHNWDINNSSVSGTPFDNLNAYGDRLVADQESEEFRISSNKNGGWDFDDFIDWVVGGYYQNFDFNDTNNLGIAEGLLGAPGATGNAINDREDQHGTDKSEAVFAHVIFNFTDQWTGTFGVRESWDQKVHDYVTAAGPERYYDIPIGFHNTSFEVGTAYQFTPDKMAYIRFAQGYEAGGYTGFPSIPNGGSSFKPEYNNEYEIGFKTDWLDKRLRVNLDFFINELSNLQVESVEPNAQVGFIQVTNNAGAATVQGAEIQLVAVPTENITTHVNVGYLEPKYDKYQGTVCSPTGTVVDCSGIPFEYTSKWTINLGGDYVMDLPSDLGTATFSADWNYRSTTYNSSPPIPESRQEGYGLVNTTLALSDPSGNYTIDFYGTNILNRKYKSEVTDSGGLDFVEDPGRPAEWGIRVTAKFGPFGSKEPPAAEPAPMPEPPPPPAPAPVTKTEVQRAFQVFFDFDKSDITQAAAAVIQKAADSVKAGNLTKIIVTGHTDTVGTAKYNQALSERRAAAVKGQLVTDGVASGEIAATGVGKTGLLVPTADGVREPQNRRAEIVLQE
jgi:iron complex outermembrane receptor protein